MTLHCVPPAVPRRRPLARARWGMVLLAVGGFVDLELAAGGQAADRLGIDDARRRAPGDGRSGDHDVGGGDMVGEHAGLLTLEEAVRKMTGLPAEVFGLTDRGGIEAGLAADHWSDRVRVFRYRTESFGDVDMA